MIIEIAAEQFKASVEIKDDVLEDYLQHHPDDVNFIERVVRAAVVAVSLDVFDLDRTCKRELDTMAIRIGDTAKAAIEHKPIKGDEDDDDISRRLFGDNHA